MAKQFRRKKSGARGLQRIIRKDLKDATQALTPGAPRSDRSLHEIRTQLKKARAGLRILRRALGRKGYRRENTALRDAARPMAELRDAKVLVDTVDQLAARAGRQQKRALKRIRVKAELRRRAARRALLSKGGPLQGVRRDIRTARKRIARRSLDNRGWSQLGRGFQRVYRNVRRAQTLARNHPTNNNLHELRKQAKYLWYGLRFLEPMRPDLVGPLADRIHGISDRLGEDHDLAVLENFILELGGDLPDVETSVILALAARRRKRLQAEAALAGRIAFRTSPEDFAHLLEAVWREWKAGA